MVSNTVVKFQIGKAGVTPAVIQQLNTLLVRHKYIRISALAASGRDRTSIRTMAESLKNQLAIPCSWTVIGFTIVLRRRHTPAKTAQKPTKHK